MKGIGQEKYFGEEKNKLNSDINTGEYQSFSKSLGN